MAKTGTDYGYTQYSREGNAADWAIKQYNSIFGRDPSQTELAQVLPSYLGADKNITDTNSGNAMVAGLYQAQQNTPQQIFQNQQAQYTKDAPKYYDQVNQTFNGLLGRDASDAEKSHFGALMASGSDPYQMQNAIQQTAEYQNKANQDYRTQLTGQLQGTQSDYYNKYILPGIQSTFANQGRPYDQQAFANAATQAGKQQNYDLQNYLAQVGTGQYNTSMANQTNQYQQYMNQLYGLQGAGVSNALNAQNQQTQQNYNIQDLNLQNQIYQNYLNQYGNRSTFLDKANAYMNFANGAKNTYQNLFTGQGWMGGGGGAGGAGGGGSTTYGGGSYGSSAPAGASAYQQYASSGTAFPGALAI